MRGGLDNLDHKLALLQALVTGDQFTPSDKGSINLALGDRAITDTSLSAGEVERPHAGRRSLNTLTTHRTRNSRKGLMTARTRRTAPMRKPQIARTAAKHDWKQVAEKQVFFANEPHHLAKWDKKL